MYKFYKKYATKNTCSLMVKVIESGETEEFTTRLYNEAMNLYNETIVLLQVNENSDIKHSGNIILQLLTVSADVGNKSAIQWLHDHDAFITKCLGENLETHTYELFMDRLDLDKNAYSLFMLGVINNTSNNPDYWDYNSKEKIGIDCIREQKNLANKYYKQAGEKGNPQAFLHLAYSMYDSIDVDHKNEEIDEIIMEAVRFLIKKAESLGGEDKVLSKKMNPIYLY